MEHRASLSSAKRELEQVRAGIRKVIEAIKAGYAGAELKAEMQGLQDRKDVLVARLAAANEPAPLLHPGMADLYRNKVASLAQSLTNPDTRTEAAEALRGLIEAIVLTPHSWRAQDRPEGESRSNAIGGGSGKEIA